MTPHSVQRGWCDRLDSKSGFHGEMKSPWKVALTSSRSSLMARRTACMLRELTITLSPHLPHHAYNTAQRCFKDGFILKELLSRGKQLPWEGADLNRTISCITGKEIALQCYQ